jgi:hypothetical protein
VRGQQISARYADETNDQCDKCVTDECHDAFPKSYFSTVVRFVGFTKDVKP